MNIKRIEVGYLKTNCYIVENNDECLVIDPGDEFDKIKDNITKNVVGVIITHNHFDHVGAVDDILKYYNVSLYNKDNLKEGSNKIGNFEFDIIYNSGHTMDSISIIFNNIMFSGDFIFEDTIGRCDLGGDFNNMKESIKKILKSDINYKIYPGHGNSTFLDKERKNLESWL